MTGQKQREATVTVEGGEPVTLANTAATRERFGWDTRAFTVRCHTGRVIRGRWSGVPVASLIEQAAFPDETTHLLVTARDDYRACVAVWDALDAFVGFVCEELEVVEGTDDRDENRESDGTPRFLASGIDSSRTVQHVATIEAVSLDPDETPRDYETGS